MTKPRLMEIYLSVAILAAIHRRSQIDIMSISQKKLPTLTVELTDVVMFSKCLFRSDLTSWHISDFFPLDTTWGLVRLNCRAAVRCCCTSRIPIVCVQIDWYTGRWWVGCYIWYSEEGPGLVAAPPSLLLAVPDVTGGQAPWFFIDVGAL